MDGESIKPMLFLPPGTTPSTAAILIVQSLRCKILECKCELSKDILQYALKILLCDDDSSLYPKSESVNGVFRMQQCASVATQTDSSSQHHASVQTEKCRIKLQRSGYKYIFAGSVNSCDVATQVAFHDFSNINLNDSEELEICIASPTEIVKNTLTIANHDNQTVLHAAKRQRRNRSRISLSLDFHGKPLINETKNKPPFTIPLVRDSDSELCDPRSFNSDSLNNNGLSRFPWRARAICTCTRFKRQRICDQKENAVSSTALMDEELHLSAANIESSNSLSPVNQSRLSIKSERCYNDISQDTSQKNALNVTKFQNATMKEATAREICSLNEDIEHNGIHHSDCFCNLAPRKACASDPRIKLICADVSVSEDVRATVKRESGFVANSSSFKKTKYDNSMEENPVTSSTREQFGCLTPNESLEGSPDTPASLLSLSPDPFASQDCQNSHIEKSLQQMSINEILRDSELKNSPTKLTLISHKENNSDNKESRFSRETNKPSTPPLPLNIDSNIECNKLRIKTNLPFCQSTTSKILQDPPISAMPPSLLSIDSTKFTVSADDTAKLPVTSTLAYTRKKESDSNKKNVSSYKEADSINICVNSNNNSVTSSTLEQDHSLSCNDNLATSSCSRSSMRKILQTKNDDLELLVRDKRFDIDNELSKIGNGQSEKLLDMSIGLSLQKPLLSHDSQELQLKLLVPPKNDSTLNFLGIPSHTTADDKNEQSCDDDNQTSKTEKESEEIYSPTDELSMDSDCDNVLPAGCSTLASPDTSPLSPVLELDENKNINKMKENNNSNPYHKVIAAVPSYLPSRRSSLTSTNKSSISNSENIDKTPNHTKKIDNISSTTNSKIDNSIPEYTTSEPDSTVSPTFHGAARQVENEITQTKQGMSECLQWIQPQSQEDYYKWYGQGSEFVSTQYQTYYPPYTNTYPPAAFNWVCYPWWNANRSQWNQLC